jgi:processing peptidase subunit alpha
MDVELEKERIIVKLQCLDQFIPILLPILVSSLFCERTQTELDTVKSRVVQEINNTLPSTNQDFLLRTAFGPSGYGMPLKGVAQSVQQITAAKFNQFIHKNLQFSKISIGANCIEQHEEFSRLLDGLFSKYCLTEPVAPIKNKYQGGVGHIVTNNPQTQVTLCYPCSSWVDNNFPVFSVLQTILGDATSFSTGGPGKGMHARAVQKVFQHHEEVESCKAIRTVFQDAGLFGIQIEGQEENTIKMINTSKMELRELGENVTAEEVERAKNILKINVLNTLSRPESRAEEMARNMLAFGELRLDSYIKVIDSVTQERVLSIAKNMVLMDPTVTIIGGRANKLNEAIGCFK